MSDTNPFKTTERSLDAVDFEMILEEGRNNGVDWVDAEISNMARTMPQLLRCLTILRAEDKFGKLKSDFTNEEWKQIPFPRLNMIGSDEQGLPSVLLLCTMVRSEVMLVSHVLDSMDAEDDDDE